MLTATAPLRVDLAGGTLDLWPLHLLHDRPSTVNVALGLRARVRYEPAGARWELRAPDLQATRRLAPGRLAKAAAEVGDGDPFAIFLQVAAHLGWNQPGRITTRLDGPPGAGLGGSSALMVALLALGYRCTGRRFERRRAAQLACDLEARVLGLPTGVQDYYPALHGGALELIYEPGRTVVRRIPVDNSMIEARMVLAYGGTPHESGPSNWNVYRRRLEGDPAAVRAFSAIALASRKAAKALRAADWRRLGEAMTADWEARKQLDPGLAPAEMRRLEAAGLDAGARAAKCCGAASGGTLLFLLREPRDRTRIEARLREAGAQIVPFGVSRTGLRLSSG